MATKPRLLDADTPERRSGSTDLVPLDRDTCALCDARLVADESAQPALFRHGGYGETRRGVAMWCPECGWQGGRRDEAENPRPTLRRPEGFTPVELLRQGPADGGHNELRIVESEDID